MIAGNNNNRLIGILLIMWILTLWGVEAYAQKAAGKTLSAPEVSEKKYPPGSAWTLSEPLGNHIESTLDTLLYNYQRQFVTALTSDAYATTGQFSGPGINMIYFQRQKPSYFFFNNALGDWIPSFSRQKFYNMYIPFTQLSYNWGFGTANRTDHLKAVFGGNVNRKIGIGAHVNYPYTKGSYENQAAKELSYGFSGYYAGDRYEMQAFYNHWNHLNKESGGITNDLYITNPAELQGGVTDIEPKSIPTRLTNAHNRVTGGELYMSHAYKLGYWKDVTQETDTVKMEEFVASTKFVYAFDWKQSHHLFIDQGNAAPDFWEKSYFNTSETQDNSYYWSVSNTLGVEMIEGFQKWAKFGLSAYATVETDRHRYESLGMEDYENAGELPAASKTRNRLWVGGRISKTRGTSIRYSADARFGLIGEAIGEIDARGELSSRFRLGKDTVRISGDCSFTNLEPDYMMRNYISNHFIWQNDFGKVRSLRATGRLYIPWSRTELSVGVENVQNQIWFDSSALPQQYSGHLQVVSAAIDQRLKFGIWNWNNTLTWQTSSNHTVMPLPALSVYSNMFLEFKAFRQLTVQVGVDCNYYTKYKGYNYQPATMAFCSQGDDAIDVGNFIFSDVYLTAKLYQVRLFLMCSNLTQGWPKSNYFSLPHYPLDPRQFRLGLSIDFAN